MPAAMGEEQGLGHRPGSPWRRLSGVLRGRRRGEGKKSYTIDVFGAIRPVRRVLSSGPQACWDPEDRRWSQRPGKASWRRQHVSQASVRGSTVSPETHVLLEVDVASFGNKVCADGSEPDAVILDPSGP